MVLRKLSSETHNCYVNYWWWKYYVIVLQFIPVSIGSYIVGKCYRVFVKMQHNLPYICTWMLLLWNVIFVWKCTGCKMYLLFTYTINSCPDNIVFKRTQKPWLENLQKTFEDKHYFMSWKFLSSILPVLFRFSILHSLKKHFFMYNLII